MKNVKKIRKIKNNRNQEKVIQEKIKRIKAVLNLEDQHSYND